MATAAVSIAVGFTVEAVTGVAAFGIHTQATVAADGTVGTATIHTSAALSLARLSKSKATFRSLKRH
jgi:hypothetical protein